MESHGNGITVGKIFSVQAYCHLLIVLSSIITHKLNPLVYHSSLLSIDSVHLYEVYIWVVRYIHSLPILWTLDITAEVCLVAKVYTSTIMLKQTVNTALPLINLLGSRLLYDVLGNYA